MPSFARVSKVRKNTSKKATPIRRRPALKLEALEAREVPAVAIQFDYSLDTAGFFNDPAKRAVLQQAANDIGSHLSANLPGVAASGGNTYSVSFFNPATGQQVVLNNPVLYANTLTVYAGGRAMSGGEAGVGGFGGFGAGGTQDWLTAIQARGVGGTMLWGGSLAFDTTASWYTSLSGAPSGNQIDFYSVASHELGHLLGIGTAPSWFAQVSGGAFHGGNADGVYGGGVPVYGDSAHWANGLTVGGTRAAMDPILQMGTRVGFSSLDYAALADIGWGVGSPTAPVVPVAPTPPPVVLPPINTSTNNPVVLTGPADGSAQAFTMSSGGGLDALGSRFTPFPGFTGVIRSAVADFNGDGVQDYAFGTGAGVGAQIRIFSGKDGSTLAGPTGVFDGFAGGVFLAAGDIDRDGRAELAVSADAGGGTRIGLFKVDASGLHRVVDFLAFGDSNFRGGSRIAMGDVNHDGYGDLIVGAGVGGAPRVAVYSGTGLLAGEARHLIPDFYALDPGLRSGVFVSAADLDGDGYSDVVYSVGNTGGPRVRIVGGATLTANPGRDAYGLPAMADFFALDPNDRNGIRLTARDLNGDGKAELIVAGGGTANPVVRVFSYPNFGAAATAGDPIAGATIDGLYVG